jgi:excisionase family DNA binding protein
VEKRFLSVRELASFLNISSDFIYMMVEQKRVPHIRLGRAIRFDIKRLESWINDNSVEAVDWDERIQGWKS